MTFNTGNPVGSTDARDLYDNAHNFDLLSVGPEHSYPDRLGVPRKSWAGLEQQFADFMVSQGWESVYVQYAPNEIVQRPTQLIERQGELYRVRLQSSLPLSLSGTWATDAPKLVAVGNQALRDLLASPNGATLIGYEGGTVASEIAALREDATSLNAIVAPTLPPSLPAITAWPKLLLKPSAGSGFYVVTRKANGKSGWVAMYVENSATPADADNTGGESNFRPTLVLNLVRAWCGKTQFFSKSANTAVSTLVASQVDQIWGYSAGGGGVAADVKTGTADFSFADRQVYTLPATGDHITYAVTARRCRVRLGMTNGSSTVVKIQVSSNGTEFFDYLTTTARMPSSGVVTGRDITVEFSATQTWYVRVLNQTVETAPAYVAGINIGSIPEEILDVDTAQIIQAPAIAGVPNQYQGGGGANEFAARSLTGKWFGTFHGGHSNFLQRLRTDNASYNLDSSTAPVLLMTTGVQLHSTSQMSSGEGTVYQYTAETQFGDGAHITHYSVELLSGPPLKCINAYTHMCTTQRDFNYIHVPKLLLKDDDGNIALGQCSMIQQFKASEGMQLNTYFSRFLDVKENGFGGAYISFQPAYNKQYYGPAVSSVVGWELGSFSAVTAKEFF